MYSAKGKGKGRVAVYDESMHVGVYTKTITANVHLYAELAKALSKA